MNSILTRLLGSLLLLVLSVFSAQAQIQKSGKPISFSQSQLENGVPNIQLGSVNTAALIAEDSQAGLSSQSVRFGYPISVNYSLSNSGKWFTMENGTRVWKLQLSTDNAYSIGLQLSQVELPVGSILYVYTPDKGMILGGYTRESIRNGSALATKPLKGKSCIIEYQEPAAVAGQGKLAISAVVYGYRNLFFKGNTTQNFGDGGECSENIMCPDASPWREVQKAVTLLITDFGTRVCTGTLVNNSKRDGKPLLLTSTSCVANGSVDSYTFVFNYESPGCQTTDGSLDQSLIGGTVKALDYDSKIALIELLDRPQDYYDVYYAGWSNQVVTPPNAVCIHHPQGDVKKLSVSDNSMYEAGLLSWTDGTYSPPGSSWRINGWHRGTTQSGSQGAPIFDQYNRVTGILTGFIQDNVYCPGYDERPAAGKLSWAWNTNLNSVLHLKPYLDPAGINETVIDGISFLPIPPPPCQGTVTVTDASGVITDGSGSGNYLANTDCRWLIAPTGASTVTVELAMLATEAGYDWVEIYDGSTTAAPLLGLYSGNQLPPYTLTSTGSSVLVRLLSDGNISRDGFALRYHGNTDACAIPTGLHAGVGSSSVQLVWDVMPGAQGYEVAYRLSTSAEWNWIRTTHNAYITLLNLEYNTEYEVRMKAICTNGASSAWTNSLAFRTLDIMHCRVPDGLAYTQLDVKNARIRWNDVAGATGYQMAFKLSTDTDWRGLRTEATNSALLEDLMVNYPYQVRVRTFCGNGEVSEWSQPFTFVLKCESTFITNVSEITDNSSLVTWFSVDNIEGYQVAYKRTSDAEWRPAQTITGVNYIALTNLEPNTLYSVRVKTYCQNAITTDWSDARDFLTEPKASCLGSSFLGEVSGWFGVGDSVNNYGNNSDCEWLIQPANARSIVLTFDKFDLEDTYDYVEVYDGNSAWAPFLGRFTGATLPARILSSGGSLFIRFHSDELFNRPGFVARYLANLFVDCTAPIGFETRVGSTSTEIKWMPVPTALRYEISYSLAGGAWSDPLISTVPNFTLRNLAYGANYAVRVRSICQFGVYSLWSTSTSFRTNNAGACDAPVVQVLTTTTNSAWIGWPVITGARRYSISWKRLSSSVWSNPISVDTNVVRIINLTSNEDYQVRVKSECLAGNSTIWSEAVTLTTGAEHCNGTVLVTEPHGTIVDGSYFHPYSNGLNCNWLIRSTGPIEAEFIAFKTVDENDYVDVYDGDSPSAELIGRFSGIPTGRFIRSTGNSLFINFVTSIQYNSEGWELRYRTLTPRESGSVAVEKITTYPNPTTGAFQVNFVANASQSLQVTVTDVAGRTITTQTWAATEGQNQINLDLAGQSSGIYFLKLEGETVNQVVKVIKQ